MGPTQGNSIDFIILSQPIQSFILGKSEDDKSFYKTIENNLKGKYLDVFVKRFDEEKVISVKGKLNKIDESGRYLVLQSDSGEVDYVYFARFEDAIVAIKDRQGKFLYENSDVYSNVEAVYRTVPGIKGLVSRGKFDSCLNEGYLSVSESNHNEQKLERA